MHVLILVAHPSPTSLTRALAAEFVRGTAVRGHTHQLLDLQAEQFSPVASTGEYVGWAEQRVPPEVQRYQDLVRSAQGLALIYPIWWATPPAILQGWLQRVFTQGFAFDYREGQVEGLLNHKTQLILNIGSRDPALHLSYVEPMIGILNYCGIRNIKSLINWGIHAGAAKEVISNALQAAFAAGQVF